MSSLPQHQLDIALIKPLLPKRQRNANKGDFGRLMIVGGNAGMIGAVMLASRAALFCGAGRIYVATLGGHASMDALYPEIMYRMLNMADELPAECCLLGPGLGQDALAKQQFSAYIAHKVPLVLDADGLNLVAQQPKLRDQLATRQQELVMTPHPGEAARLLQKTVEEIQQNRVESAIEIARQFQSVCVLKGEGTVIANAEGEFWVNHTGNPGLATAGTGDVLAGALGALMAQGLSGLESAKLAVFVHGLAADTLVEKGHGPVGLTAGEVAMEMRQTLNRIVYL